jgi:acyl-CoA thioesterase
MGVSGRQIRVVDGAYSPDPDRVGPPEIHAWVRFRDAPPEPCLHAALAVQSTTHWGIAAAMRPHPGFGEAQAHTSLSTAPMSIAVALHADIDVTQWLLYSNTSTHAGRGLAQSDGKVFTADGRLVASYTVQAMIRAFARDPSSLPDPGTAM